MSPLYVSFYTTGNGYEAEAAGLVESLDRLGLPHEVVGVAPFVNWQRATQYKAEFLALMGQKHPDRPLVWLDADARVRQRPELFDAMGSDFAAHWLGDREMLAGTLYLAPSAAMLVLDWVERNRQNPDGENGDQGNLRDVLQGREDIRVARLPPEYAWLEAEDGVEDVSSRIYGQRQPVIQHRQASRRLRT